MHTDTLLPENYLRNFLPTCPEWGQDPTPVFERIAVFWQQFQSAAGQGTVTRSQTERQFVLPVLKVIGWDIVLPITGGALDEDSSPHIALFADTSRAIPYPSVAYDTLVGKGPSAPRQDSSAPSVILMVQPWSMPLLRQERVEGGTASARPNADQVMVRFLVASSVSWGILTNGRRWRLYRMDPMGIAARFYDVDLTPLFTTHAMDDDLHAEAMERFRRWWLCFRREAFRTGSGGNSFIERLADGGIEYARFIADRLRERVINQVLPIMVEGFIQYYRESAIRQSKMPDLEEVEETSLSLLHRLLFLFYAEAKRLLPVDDPRYRRHSVSSVVDWAQACNPAKDFAPASSSLFGKYDMVQELIRNVEAGNEEWGIPRYGGNFFSPRNPAQMLLAKYKLNDWYLARLFSALTQDIEDACAALSVRDLISACQGLSAYNIRIKNEASGASEWAPPATPTCASPSTRAPLHLVTYLVEQTLRPVLQARETMFNAVMDQVVSLRRQRLRGGGQADMLALQNQWKAAAQQAADAYLGIKVLDLAVRAGDLLVQSTDYLTDQIIARLQSYHDANPTVPWSWNPIGSEIDTERRRISAQLARSGIDFDEEQLTDTVLLRRLILKQSIYGVGCDPTSVELAKLSLWLHTFVIGAPLSFLGHHLRWGNPLVGTDVRSVEQSVSALPGGQAGLFPDLMDRARAVLGMIDQADGRLTHVRWRPEDYGEFRNALTPYKQVLDLHVCRALGEKAANELLQRFGVKLPDPARPPATLDAKTRQQLSETHALWEKYRYFHWDLEFPEVFVDLRKREWIEEAGFDAVLVDPTAAYEQLSHKIDARLLAYFKTAYSTATGDGSLQDICRCFVERGLGVLRATGYLGAVLPDRVAVTRSGPTGSVMRQIALV